MRQLFQIVVLISILSKCQPNMARQVTVLQEINDKNNSPQLAGTSTAFGGQNVPDMGDVSFLQPLIRYQVGGLDIKPRFFDMVRIGLSLSRNYMLEKNFALSMPASFFKLI